MEEGAEDRRKRLRAMATEAAAVGQNEIPLASAPPTSALPNPHANTMPPPQPPPPPYPPGPPHQPHWGHHHADAYPTSFGRGGGRRGRGRTPRGRGGGGGGRGGRGGGRGHAPPAANIEAYFSPQMLSNPWSHLERRHVPASVTDTYEAEDRSGGKFDNEGILDRPWH